MSGPPPELTELIFGPSADALLQARYDDQLAAFLRRHPFRRFARWLAIRAGWDVYWWQAEEDHRP